MQQFRNSRPLTSLLSATMMGPGGGMGMGGGMGGGMGMMGGGMGGGGMMGGGMGGGMMGGGVRAV